MRKISLKNLFLYLAFALMLGCAYAQTKSEPQDPTEVCLNNLSNQKELQVLRGKIVLGGESQSLEILSNTKKPNQLEKNALLSLDRLIDQCRSQGKDWRMKNYPSSLNSVIDSTFFSNYKFLLADLYAGKFTFGDFARKRQELGTELTNAISNENLKIQKNLDIENSNLQRKQGELEQQRLYQKQQECRTANQQIMEAVRALNQAKAQQQANAQNQAQIESNRSAQMSPDAWGRSMVYQGASQFGNAIGGALGAEDALQAQERRIQEAIQQYKSVCEK